MANGEAENGNGRRWYDDHIKVLAGSIAVATVMIVTPIFYLIVDRKVAAHETKQGETFQTISRHDRDIDRIERQASERHRELMSQLAEIKRRLP